MTLHSPIWMVQGAGAAVQQKKKHTQTGREIPETDERKDKQQEPNKQHDKIHETFFAIFLFPPFF